MTEIWDTYLVNWKEWLNLYWIWLVAVIGGIVLILVAWRLIRQGIIRRKLPGKTARSDWRAFLRHHEPRQLRAAADGKTRAVKEQLTAFQQSLKEDLGHFLVLLTPMASGRTWLLMEVMRELYRRYKRVWMVSMNQEDPLRQIRSISNPEHTWLILDDLESFHPELQARERINLILECTDRFKAVILAVQPDRWPLGWQQPDQLGRIKLVGEDHFTWGFAAWLTDWTTEQATAWLRRYAGPAHVKSIQRVIDGLDWRNQLWRRPAVLKVIVQTSGIKGPGRYLNQFVDRALQKAIGATNDPIYWERLQALAINGKQPENMLPVPKSLKPILQQDQAGEIRFRHRLYEGFFLSSEAILREDKSVFRELISHPEARMLYLEAVWSEFLDMAGPAPGRASFAHHQALIPLRNLSVDQLAQIEFLELDDLRIAPLMFLRLTRSLKRIWAPGEEADLPLVTRHWKPAGGARIWLQGTDGMYRGWERIVRFDEKKRWEPVGDLAGLHPALAPSPSFERSINHPFRKLFRLDPDSLPNPLCKPVSIPLDDQQGLVSVKEMILGAGEFELFDKVFIYEFDTGDIHLQYLHSRPTNNLIPLLSNLLTRWNTLIGADDEGHQELSLEEKEEIRRGCWAGRIWSSGKTDFFDRTAVILMPRAHSVEIWLRNGKPNLQNIS